MAHANLGISGRNYDAFVSSQRDPNDPNDLTARIQEKYWQARQKFLAKIEKREDSCIVLSDSKLDAKLQIHRSIEQSCGRLTEVLEDYQNCLYVLANEQNSLGILLRDCSKLDKTKAGKIMIMTSQALTESSHQQIRLYMPLLRLHQEMETFYSRAVEDCAHTVDKLESKRAQYRASLLWMKDISEKLDPDVYRQLDRFRKVQNKVRKDKKAFDAVKMDVVQKIDLMMASRCNLMNQILAPYQTVLLETFERDRCNFNSIEALISKEDLYEYEFKALRQLNPLQIPDDPPDQEQSTSQTQQSDKNNNLQTPKLEPEPEIPDLIDVSDARGDASIFKPDDSGPQPEVATEVTDNLMDLFGQLELACQAESRDKPDDEREKAHPQTSSEIDPNLDLMGDFISQLAESNPDQQDRA